MAGPCCGLLLVESLSNDRLVSLEGYVYDIGEHIRDKGNSSWDFWVSADKVHLRNESEMGCLFSVYAHTEDAERFLSEYAPEDIILIEQAIGTKIKGYVEMNAGCNAYIDHRLLGMMALALLEKFNGYIDFAGIVPQEQYGAFEGALHNIDGSQLADKKFLREYLSHPNFRMIK